MIDYEVISKNLTSKMTHELLFSVRKRWFVKPYRSDRHLGRLYYKLLPGNYVKFSLSARKSQDWARFQIIWVYVSKEGKVEEKVVYDIETSLHIFVDIPNDINAPYILAEFILMRPEFHNVAHVEDTNYSTAEDAMQIIESIRKYIEKLIASD